MNIQREKLRCLPMGAAAYFGKSSSSSASNTTTNNTDNRTAVQDGIAVAGSSGVSIVSSNNDPDVVRAIAGMGADVIAKSGAAVVDLNKASLSANVEAWDKTIQGGVSLVDKLIDSATSLGTNAINSFQPTENKESGDFSKVGMFAAAAAAAAFLLSKAK